MNTYEIHKNGIKFEGVFYDYIKGYSLAVIEKNRLTYLYPLNRFDIVKVDNKVNGCFYTQD